MTTHLARRTFLTVGAGALVLGLAGGLSRLGISPSVPPAAEFHGVLMICGFFGTLISLERAVAHGHRIAAVVPGLSAVGVVLLLIGAPEVGLTSFVAAGLGLVALTLSATIRLPTIFMLVMTLGAILWPAGTFLLLAGRPVPEVSYILLAFLVLTIVAERVELSRLAERGRSAAALLVALVAAMVIALAFGQPRSGSLLLSMSLAGLGIWLLFNDIARITIRRRGIARFSAVSLGLGFLWLLAAAGILGLFSPVQSPSAHDAALHAIGIGFVMSMVFAHAPIILPAVVGIPVAYTCWLYLPLAMLQLSAILRLVGDGSSGLAVLQCSAWTTIGSLVLYAGVFLHTLYGARRPRHTRHAAPPARPPPL